MLSVSLKSIVIKDKVLLHDINFRLADNKINIILGKNGTGKSTLIKALTRLLDERFYSITGSVFLDKVDLLDLQMEELLNIRRSKIRYVFQDAVNSFDPLKKIGYYFRKFGDDQKIGSLIDDFLLPGKEKLFGLYPYEISGGMAQRLLLVLALLANPDVLLLDEPTSGIDIPITNIILLRLREFVKNNHKSVLLVTQDLEFAKNAGERISYLSEGTLSPFYDAKEFFEAQRIPEVADFISAYNQLI